MNSQTKINSLQYLSFISHDASSLHTKIATGLLQHKSPYILEMMIMSIEYFQLMSLALLLAPAVSEDTYLNQNPIFKALVFMIRLFDLGFWLYSETHGILTLVVLILFAILTIFKYTLYLYVFLVATEKIKAWDPLIYIWKLIFKTQARVSCYFVSSLWVTVLVAAQNGEEILGIDKSALIILSGLMIASEYVFSFFLQVCYTYILPAKNFLSCRDNYLEVITLTQKLIIQFLQTIVPASFTPASWIFVSVNILFSLLREISYFRTLPLYNLSALIYQAALLMLIFSLNIACFIQNILYALDYKNSISFIIVTWATLSLLTITISTSYFKTLHLKLADLQNKDQPRLIIHRIRSILDLHKLKKCKKYVTKHSFSLLASKSISASIESILGLKLELKDEELASKESIRKAISEYLQHLYLKYPKNEFIKLYTAYFYITKFPTLGVAMKMLSELQKSGSYKISLNASLLKRFMEERIARGFKKYTSDLDIYKYLRSRSQVAQLEQKVLSQIEIQIKFYLEVLSDSPDLAKIFNFSQDIYKQKQDIDAKTKIIFNTVPDYYLRPLTVCALYHSLLTFSVDDYLYYHKKYTQVRHKYDKFYLSDKLCEENMFQDSNALIILSAQKHECGRVTFVSKSIEKIYGRDPQFYIGRGGSIMAAPSLQDMYTKFYEYLEIKGPQSLSGTISGGLGYHVDGYILPADFLFNLHPFTTQGLYLDVIARPSPIKKEYMLILENGNIEGATHKFAKRFGLLKAQRKGLPELAHVKEISDDLNEINDAFNLVYRAPAQNESLKKQDAEENESQTIVSFFTKDELRSHGPKMMNLQTAQDICSVCSNEGKTITIYSSKNVLDHVTNSYRRVTYSYHCTVQNKIVGPVYLKELTLEEIRTDSQESLDDYTRDPTEKLLNKVENSSQSENNNDDLEEGQMDLFRFEDEKETGWVDFKTLETKSLRRIDSTKQQQDIQEDKTISALTLERVPSTSRAPLITEQKLSKFHRSMSSTPIARLRQEREDKKEMEFSKENAKNEGVAYEENSIASITTKNSKQQKISRAFRAALETRHFPIFFRFITVIFYLLFVAIFVTQLISKVALDRGIENLRVGKDIIQLAGQRSFYLSNVHQYTRLSWSVANHRIGPSDLGRYSYLVPLVASIATSNTISLATVNKKFFNKTNLLYQDIQQKLFAKDVQMIDNNTSEYVNNFQSIEILVEATLRMANLVNKDYAQADKYITFILRNALNNIYLKNEDVMDSLTSFFANEKESIYTNIKIVLIFTGLFVGGILIVLTIITWRKYSEEKLNMSAVTRINNEGIRAALDKITALKTAIENESSLDNDEDRQNTEFLEQDRKNHKFLIANVVKKEHHKTPNIQGILRKYLVYLCRVWIFTLLIAGTAVANCLVGRSSLEFFSRKTDQLSLMGQIKGAASIGGSGQREMFSGNGTTLIRNMPSLTYMKLITNVLNGMKNKLASTFMKDDFTYDPAIANVLFSDGCSRIVEDTMRVLCYEMKIADNKGNMVYLLTDYINLLQDQVEKFVNSNRTTETLMALQLEKAENITSDQAIIVRMSDVISNLTNQEFDAEIISGKQQRGAIFYCLLVMLAVLSVLIWIYVLRRLVDYGQQFKRVLEAFPPSLVLSNFVLKSFLMKTSKGALDSIKNDI